MISLNEVLQLHENSIRDYGGSFGVRDMNLLESAIARPFQTFEGTELYPTVYEKVAALIESIVKNHPFIDGNKRTGFLVAFAFLQRNNLELIADNFETYDFVISIANGDLTFEQITEWLKNNASSL
jgi:death-on-curing protein